MTGHRSSPEPSNRSAAAAELQQLLVDSVGIEEFLEELVRLAVAAVPGECSCGLTLRRDHQPVTVASSDVRASRVDEVQYGHRNGPCLTSLRTGEVVTVDDLTTDDRWPGYAEAALAEGVRSSLSLPVAGRDGVVGALNLYAGTPTAFGRRERRAGEAFAAEAGRALALSIRLAESTEMSENLQAALASRAVIDQALGIIMAQYRCTAAEAFDRLRRLSQNRNVKLRVLAADLVASTSRQRPDTSTG
jgi:GAF domain-containing protein